MVSRDDAIDPKGAYELVWRSIEHHQAPWQKVPVFLGCDGQISKSERVPGYFGIAKDRAAYER